MTTLTITVELDNAAFDDNLGPELARILTTYAHAIQGADDLPCLIRTLRDSNGNTVGDADLYPELELDDQEPPDDWRNHPSLTAEERNPFLR